METLKINLADFGGLFRSDATKLSDQELLSMDFILHRAWTMKRSGHRVFEDGKDWDFPELLDLHAQVRREMSRRSFQHAIKDELDDQTQPLIRSASRDIAEKQAGTIIQSVILAKETFPTERQASRWVEDHGFRADKVDETENSFRFRQREPGDFDSDGFGRGQRFRTIPLTNGVQAVIGFLREKSLPEASAGPEDPLASVERPPSFTLRGVVTAVDQASGLPEIRLGLDFQNMKVEGSAIRSAEGKLYLEVGSALAGEAQPDVGDLVQADCGGLAFAKRQDGTLVVVASELRIVGVPLRGRPMTVGEAAKAARAAGAFRELEAGDPAEEILKGVRQAFGSYGGKRFLAHRIASYIPHHRTYVEPFAGGAAVLYAKDPSPQEVLNDRDPEIAFMHRFIRNHSPEDRAALAKREWTIRKDVHERLKELKPESDRDRFYKAFYLTRSSYGKMRGGSFNPANAGVRIDFPANIERAQARLKNVAVSNKDYLEVLKEHDGPETFFYIDPPYPGEFNLFDFGFKEEEFARALKGLNAKWMCSYTAKRPEVFKGFHVHRVKRRNQMKGPGGNQEWVTELLVSNFPLKPLHLYIEKELTFEPEGMEAEASELLPQLTDDEDLEKIQGAFKSPGGKYRLAKKLVRLLPKHKTFVECFCGGAQVFFHKARSETEVLNDVNADLIAAYRFIKGMTDEDLEWLRGQRWVISRAHAKRLFESTPRTPRERFYRFAYLNKAQYWGRTDIWEGMRPNGSTGLGAHIRLVDKLPKIRERLQGVKLHSWDWRDVIKEYDGPGAFLYLDPPYPSHWPRERGKFGDKFFQEDHLLPALKAIKGRFLLSYELRKAEIFKGFRTYRVKTLHTGSHQLGGARKEYELLVANYELKPGDLYVEKSPSE